MKKSKFYLLVILASLCLMPDAAFAQSLTVEGTVTDEKGKPLVEANVGIGFVTPWDAVITDSQGHFDLWMPFRDTTIRVNHLGYQPQQVQPTDTILTIRMKSSIELREPKVTPKK